MKIPCFLISCVCLLVFLPNCAGPRTGPGLFVTHLKEGITATDSADALIEGRACATNVLGLISVGDASIDAAKKDGDISVVSSVDAEWTSVLVFFVRHCTVVRGKS